VFVSGFGVSVWAGVPRVFDGMPERAGVTRARRRGSMHGDRDGGLVPMRWLRGKAGPKAGYCG
jgi:hypothetical protein